MILICKRCKKRWRYSGKSSYWASCPNCKTSVKIRKKAGGIMENLK